ncbi:hypothetical protein NM688_g1925 [Phlebia brevispora]|uniref:Uncharacterized protein n=1 Tax=Phlebia brevispora TaxID=194682 RepID=A0ACC1TAE3_9APHY|nr:hypothetical protein NM688_g1925 [Phlebia brevispora]
MNSNISQLQPQPPSQVQRSSKDGQDKAADAFLALRLLNKKARVRLSAEPVKLDPIPGRATLFAVANASGSYAAITCNSAGEYALIASTLAELRASFASSSSEDRIAFTPRRTIPLPGPVNTVSFASGDSRLLVASAQGQIQVYDAFSLVNPNGDTIVPMKTFASPAGTAARELLSNPGDLPDLVAVLYDGAAVVHLLDVQKLEVVGGWTGGGTPDTTPMCLSWSPKGKQLAIGLQNGAIVTYSPADTSNAKSHIPAPSSVEGQSVIGLTWLSNPDFHCIYAPFGPLTPDSEQTHVIISYDHKVNTETDVKLTTPYYPVPGLRPPGSFNAVLRHWDPSKFLLFAADSTSSDIGLIGCTAEQSQEIWCNYSLEENSTPSLPLDKDMNDTVLLGLILDLTGTETYDHTTVSGEVVTLPPPPVMYAYVSDGTILGWSIINTFGTPYPGMTVPSSAAADTTILMDTSVVEEKPPVVVSPPPIAPVQTPFFEQGAFGQPSTLGQSAFGSTGFGQTSAPGTTSGLGVKAPVSGGFGAFASTGTSKFGQTSFGLSSLAPPSAGPDNTSLASPMTISMSNSRDEEPMSADVDTSAGFGGLSLGGTSDAAETDKVKAGGLFGAFTTPEANKPASAFSSSDEAGLVKPATGFGAFANQSNQTPSAFMSLGTSTSGEQKLSGESGSSFLKPATGFGAYANQGPSAFGVFGSTPSASAQSKPSAFSGVTTSTTATSQASPAFGQSGFAAKSAFGQSSFGQSSFGQPAFGQSAFGSAPTTKSAFGSTGSTGGGFAAFASGGTSGFGSFAKSAEAEPKPTATETVKPEPVEAEMIVPETPVSETTQATPTPAPATPIKAEPATPDIKPAAAPKSEAPSTTPTTSPSVSAFKSSAPGPATGAFANLTAHPTGFGKLDSGFGAFGNVTPSSSSPLPQPTEDFPPLAVHSTAQPTFGAPSAFGAAASAEKPTFGSSSSLGSSTAASAFGKSAFGQTIKPAAPTTGGFSAFASSGGFSAFSSGGKKSFSELLKGGEASDKGKAQPQEKGTEPKEKIPPSATAEVPKKPVSVFATLSREPSTSAGARTSEWKADQERQSAWEEAKEGEESGEEGETESFLSENFTEEEEEEEEEELPNEPEDEEAVETPPIRLVSSSPPESPAFKGKEKLAVEGAEKSTTPPGSPLKEVPPAAAPPPTIHEAFT